MKNKKGSLFSEEHVKLNVIKSLHIRCKLCSSLATCTQLSCAAVARKASSDKCHIVLPNTRCAVFA